MCIGGPDKLAGRDGNPEGRGVVAGYQWLFPTRKSFVRSQRTNMCQALCVLFLAVLLRLAPPPVDAAVEAVPASSPNAGGLRASTLS